MRNTLDKFTEILNIFTFISAFAGSYYLVNATPLTMPYELLKYTPFNSFLIPGLILGLIVGGSNLVSFILYSIRNKYRYVAELATGVLLSGWIICEYLLIREFSFLQVIYLSIGGMLILLNFKKFYASMVSL